MGYSGCLVFARCAGPLVEAPVFDRIGEQWEDALHECTPRPGGWQTLQLTRSIWEDEYLSPLVEWTGAPACVADVFDSDVALVTGLDTGGRCWQAWLNLDKIAALVVAEPDDVDDMSVYVGTPAFDEAVRRKRAELEAEVASSAEGALAWAAGAGVQATAQHPRIEELLRADEVFVEDLLFRAA
jgi:hypothetical protein